MGVLLRGTIVENVPLFKASIRKRMLMLDGKGDLALTVDTGFSGGIALPSTILENIDAELAFYDTFKTATGEIIELPVYTGSVKIKNKTVDTWFIPGDSLLGMEFLSSIGNRLSFTLDKRTVRLSK